MKNMTTAAFKKNAPVNASTIRGTDIIPGKIASINETAKGVWYKVKPDDKTAREFQTRASKITHR